MTEVRKYLVRKVPTNKSIQTRQMPDSDYSSPAFYLSEGYPCKEWLRDRFYTVLVIELRGLNYQRTHLSKFAKECLLTSNQRCI
ncbi:hypothetical protein DDB_G0293648 [Dictyostelium discoideum AX4]|uniref:Putative uncharacterized protein DDB_G0293648 n=1 Tax=Dictyostelium discoideum TaxID=44689 RepID=Y2071_DICDI|nr:hypothetical protein DDB_G0293648 [Dictyostelium discoideum AX4]Q54BF4.1 RecName: Full=Putative uncharacterized protein DDB_G0293648 [Dictyostelium discoideum]EAL60636.1 hypothetical protein DDB_G0293648 [Dictyostelium discoideum AX4]|eukprot:XP_629075.1 hypothetical protein DDB_G0293648 [Dictyostelium discoideum AX4]